jgi:hypothetical protein
VLCAHCGSEHWLSKSKRRVSVEEPRDEKVYEPRLDSDADSAPRQGQRQGRTGRAIYSKRDDFDPGAGDPDDFDPGAGDFDDLEAGSEPCFDDEINDDDLDTDFEGDEERSYR